MAPNSTRQGLAIGDDFPVSNPPTYFLDHLICIPRKKTSKLLVIFVGSTPGRKSLFGTEFMWQLGFSEGSDHQS